mgnify:CR=1 FL=1
MGNFSDNRIIKDTISRINRLNDEKFTYMLADVFMHRIHDDGTALTIMNGDDLWVYECSHKKKWIVLFTDEVEANKGNKEILTKEMPIKDILKGGLGDDINGVIINPYGENRDLVRETIEMIFFVYKKEYHREV